MTGLSVRRPMDLGRRMVGPVVLLAAAALVIGGLRTSLAEVTASTSSTGLFSAGSIELEQIGEPIELLFDEDLLYPGVASDACVEIAYRGSVPAEIRVFAETLGGSGLDEFIRFEVWTSARPCSAAEPTGVPLFGETLRDFWESHGDYGSGVEVGHVSHDQVVTMLVRAELLDVAEAAGLYTEFALVVEARP